MKLKKRRFIGNQAFRNEDASVFFGREAETAKLYEFILSENYALLSGKSTVGKSSLLQAGLFKLLNNSKVFEAVYIDFSQISEQKIIDYIKENIKIPAKDTSYIDKILPEDKSLWKHLKKYKQKKALKLPLVILFDGLEYLLKYDKTVRQNVYAELSDLLKPELPRRIKSKIEEKLAAEPDMLTEEAQTEILKPAGVKFVFAFDEEHRGILQAELDVFFPNLSSNQLILSDFKINTASEIVLKTATYEHHSRHLDSFDTAPFTVDNDLIINCLTVISDAGDIAPSDLQLLGQMLEETALKKHLDHIDSKDFNFKLKDIYRFLKSDLSGNEALGNPDKLLKNSYKNFINPASGKSQKLSKTALKEGLNIDDNTLNLLKNIIRKGINSDGTDYFQLKSAFIEKILAVNTEKNSFGIERNNNETSKNASFSGLLYKLIGAFVVLLLIAFVFIMNSRKQVRQAWRDAESNLYAAYAFQNLETDPTLSFRQAEKAHKLNPENIAAFSALISAYYKSEVFYALDAEVDSNAVFSVLSPDSKQFASVVRKPGDKQYYLQLKTTDNRLLFEYPHKNRILFIEFSDDNSQIIFGDTKGLLTILDASGHKTKQFRAHESMIWTAKFSPDRTHILSSGGDRRIILSDMNGNLLREFPAHDFDVYAVNFSPNGEYIATGFEHIDICNAAGTLQKRISLNPNNYFTPLVQYIEFSSDSKYFLAVVNDVKGQNHTIRIFDVQGNELALLRGHKDWINQAHFSSDGTKILSVSRDKTARLWSVNTPQSDVIKGHTANVSDARFEGNINKIISVSDDKTVRSWTFGRLLNPLAKISNINKTKFTPDGFGILVAADTSAFWCDIAGDIKSKFTGISKKITALDISADKKYIAVASKDKTVRIYTQNGKEMTVIGGLKHYVTSLDFHPDSAILLTGDKKGQLAFWDMKGNLSDSINTNSKINAVSFSPDGQTIITAQSDGSSYVRTRKGKLKVQLKGHHKAVLTAEFSPDGQYIITTGKDKTARLWTADGHRLHVFSDYRNMLSSAEFSPDGKFLLTASRDGYVKLYLLNGQEIAEFKHQGKVRQASFSPDGMYILSVIEKDRLKSTNLQVISPEKILELTNETKIFGNFYQLKDK